ncbi:uncharacterized protein LOC115411310 isoform X2 [Sphaeramia orbicularis]|nr:uncharacterized protein LOC115411310 isoform X2 [Sphaeramia orbicularis]
MNPNSFLEGLRHEDRRYSEGGVTTLFFEVQTRMYGRILKTHCDEFQELHRYKFLKRIRGTHLLWKLTTSSEPEAPHGDTASGSSVFGFVWQVGDFIRQYLSSESRQVLLFLSPPEPNSQRRMLHVLLQPCSVSVYKVKEYYPNAKHIKVSTTCKLVTKHKYRLECPEAHRIQPYEAEFELNLGPIHPQFEIWLPAKLDQVNLTIKDQRNRKVWEENVNLLTSPQRLAQALRNMGDRIPSSSSFSFVSGGFIKLYQDFTSVCVQVLLFLEPPITQTRRLHVLLLQHDVNLEDVNPFGKRPPRDAVLIRMPGTCELITRQKYRAGCPEAIMIMPKEAVFDQNDGKHYSSKFMILLPAKTSQLTLRIRDQENKEVWTDKFTLPETPYYEMNRHGPEKWQYFSTDVLAGPSKWEEFTPEASTESRKTLYRFRCPHSGSFHCTQTGLVFVVDQKRHCTTVLSDGMSSSSSQLVGRLQGRCSVSIVRRMPFFSSTYHTVRQNLCLKACCPSLTSLMME